MQKSKIFFSLLLVIMTLGWGSMTLAAAPTLSVSNLADGSGDFMIVINADSFPNTAAQLKYMATDGSTKTQPLGTTNPSGYLSVRFSPYAISDIKSSSQIIALVGGTYTNYIPSPFLTVAPAPAPGGGVPAPGGSGGSDTSAPKSVPETFQEPGDIVTLLNTIANWMYTIFMVLAVIFIVMAAYRYLISSGGEGVSKAHKMLIYAAVAIAVALLANGFVRVVESLVGA